MLCPDDTVVWHYIPQPLVGGVADVISEDGETCLSEDSDEIQETGPIVDVCRLSFEDRQSIDEENPER